MANLKDIGYGVGKYLEVSDASDLPNIGTNRTNIDLLNFKVATNNAYALYNFKDGMIDAYQTEAGVDTATSTNESYDSAGKYYSGKIPATGGTITTHGSYTVHSFTNTGNTNFVVGTAGNVSVLVVGGGGGGGKHSGGGGGAGGFRTSASLAVTAQTYTVTVGAGGAGNTGSPAASVNDGGDSVFSSITSTGGGGGAISGGSGRSGGSGGGDAGWASAGAGNTPSTSPSQGNPGGGNAAASTGSGGGGASAAGAHGGSSPGGIGGPGGAGGNGTANDYRTGSNVTYAGGGGGGSDSIPSPNPGGAGGSGGGGAGSGVGAVGTAGTANTGGGGGGSGTTSHNGGAGGSGIVVVRYTTGDLLGAGNLTLVSNAQTAQAAPTTGRLMIYEETSTGTTTLDTDLKGYVSRDGGTTYTQTPLTLDTTYETGKTLVSGSVDISGQPSGTNMKYKIETLNQSASKVWQITWSIFALVVINVINS